VLMSVYNCENFIEQALKSIYNQTYQDFEVIIVDDASTDKTSEILVEMKDSRTFIYRNSGNLGLTKSLNIGLKLCRGKYIARMDADDISDPQRFEKQVRYLDENPKCLALGSWYKRIDSAGQTWGTKETPTAYENIKQNLLIGNCVGHGSAMLRRSALVEIGGYNEKYIYAQDYDLWLRLSEVGEIRNLGEYLYSLRSWRGAISAARDKQQNEYAELALQESLRRKSDSEPVNVAGFRGLANRAVGWFNSRRYSNCIATLNNAETMQHNIAKRFKSYDLLRAMAYFSANMKQRSLEYLKREIENHNNPAAKKFISDYFENEPATDVQGWCQQNAGLYDLRIIDLESVSDVQHDRPEENRQIRTEPLVSVIMPAYNAAEYIAAAIESVLNQDYRNFELIIINDGSTDDTEKIIHGFKDGRIRYFRQENRGLAATHNTGIRQSRGELIIKLDADDKMTPDFIARHLQQFEKDPEADLVYCDDLLIDQNDKQIRIIKRPEYADRKLLIRDMFRSGFPVVPFRTCIRRAVFDKIGFFDESLPIGEDYDMMRRFIKFGLKIRHLPSALYMRRMTENSLSRNLTPQKAKCQFELVRRFTETFTYDELFPDIEWNEIPADKVQVHARCLVVVTYLAIGQDYLDLHSAGFYAKIAFENACSELRGCLKIDPGNRQIRELLQKCELGRQKYEKHSEQLVC
jgi:glycosyltransferase involved in cell wall biosynthesis